MVEEHDLVDASRDAAPPVFGLKWRCDSHDGPNTGYGETYRVIAPIDAAT
jgi:hypothetical protein